MSDGEMTKIPMATLVELHRSFVERGETYRRTTITATLHGSEIYGRVATWKPLLSVKRAKKHLKDSQTVRSNIGLMNLKHHI